MQQQQEEHTGLLRIAQRHFRTAVLLLTTPSVLDEAAIDLLLRKASAALLLARRCCLLGATACKALLHSSMACVALCGSQTVRPAVCLADACEGWESAALQKVPHV